MSVFLHKIGFSQTSQLLFMFQCNEHVETNKFVYSLSCTWMTIIDISQGLKGQKIGPVRIVCRFIVTYIKTFSGVLPLI